MSLTSEFEMDGDDFNGVKFTYSDGVVEFEFCGYLWDIEETKERFGRFLRNAKNGEFQSSSLKTRMVILLSPIKMGGFISTSPNTEGTGAEICL